MKSIRSYIGWFLLIFSSYLFAQEKTNPKLIAAYKAHYGRQHEKVYLDLNKKTFIPGEIVFFKAYIFNQQKRAPLQVPANLYVGLYDNKGKQLKRTLWEVTNGIAKGSFKIAEDQGHGDYFIKADTESMRSHDGKGQGIRKIQIIEYESSNDSEFSDSYDVRIVVEGGTALSGMINTIGFQVSNSKGDGIEIKDGEIFNSRGDLVLGNIKSNSFGFGKFDLFLDPEETYSCTFVTSSGMILTKEIPKASLEGFALNVTGNRENRIVSIRTNQETLKKRRNPMLNLVIHRDGVIKSKTLALDKESQSFSLRKNDLQPGVNIISLLDKNWNVLGERLIFNPSTNSKLEIESKIWSCGKMKDSLCMSIRPGKQNREALSLSVSILAAENVDEEKLSIPEAMLLRPYLNPEAFFRPLKLGSVDNESFTNLDLVMLVHGRSNLSWPDLKSEPDMPDQKIESGVTVSGQVLNKNLDKIESLLMYQDQIQGMQTTDIDSAGYFSIPDAKIKKGQLLHFSLLDRKNKMVKPELKVTFSSTIELDSLDIEAFEFPLIQPLSDVQETNDLKLWLEDKQERLLDEITLNATRKEEEPSRNENLIGGFWTAEKISEEDLIRKRSLSNYLRGLGFKVKTDPLTGWLFVQARLSGNPAIGPPVIYLDGFRLFGPLPDYQLHSIDEIYYEHAGLQESNGGTIYIYLRDNGIIGQKNRSRFTSLLAENGFDVSEEFMNFLREEDVDEMFKKYGCIYWEPNAVTDEKGEINLKFAGMGERRFKVFVEGVSAGGSLISEMQMIDSRQVQRASGF